MANAIRWSLIVPSRDGADTLPECLASLAALPAREDGLEILLVDNASQDATRDLMLEFCKEFGGVFLSEQAPGKSHALNAAISRARGEMLVFLDDDVVVAPGLIEAYDVASHAFPEAEVLAGQIRPAWKVQPPQWLASLADQGWSFGCTPLTRDAGWVHAPLVKGGNMCLRRAVVAEQRFAVGAVNFGATSRGIGGEDSEFVRRVAAGGRIRYVPDARVGHVIAAHEMNWRSVFARYLRIGRGNMAQGLVSGGGLGSAARAAVYGCAAVWWWMVGNRGRAARNGIWAAMQLGALQQMIQSTLLSPRASAKDPAGEIPPASPPAV